MLPLVASAGVVEEAREMRRQLRYAEATQLLESKVDALGGAERAQALLLLAALSADHKEARRLLRDAANANDSPQVQRAADLELGRLDYARGNYNNVRTRLEHYPDAECRLLLAQSLAALGETDKVAPALAGVGSEQAELLRAWAERESGDVEGALARLEKLAAARADAEPVVLLWKAECESRLGQTQRARDTAAALRRDYPDGPEVVLLQPTLSNLQHTAAPAPPATAGTVVLQLGVFEERGNALRFRESLPRSIGPVELDTVTQSGRSVVRVRVGPFDSREAAETYGRTRLDPLRLDWRIAPLELP
jgi:cell division septation protein DedD